MTPRHKAFREIVELAMIVEQRRRRTSLAWTLALRVTTT
ncbi:hypothetical protein PI125_g4665 [Phytophthora idaei]|nr:hypothetical protein PI125_g4665 [Phytophthora idaei]